MGSEGHRQMFLLSILRYSGIHFAQLSQLIPKWIADVYSAKILLSKQNEIVNMGVGLLLLVILVIFIEQDNGERFALYTDE